MAAKATENSVRAIADFEVIANGITPLLLHQDDVEWADTIAEERDRIKRAEKGGDNSIAFRAGDDRVPAATWKGYAYNDGERLVLPTANLQRCLVAAGAMIPMPNKPRSSMKKPAASGIMFDDPFVPLLIGTQMQEVPWNDVARIDGKFSEHVAAARNLGFDLQVKRAKVGMSKHVRVRPLFARWAFRAGFAVDLGQIDASTIETLWQYAGSRCGIGDWRPSAPMSPGPYGKFAVEVRRKA